MLAASTLCHSSAMTLANHLTSLNLYLLISKIEMLSLSLQGYFKDQGYLLESVINECGILEQERAISGETVELWVECGVWLIVTWKH